MMIPDDIRFVIARLQAKPETAETIAEIARLNDLIAEDDLADVGYCDCCNRIDHLSFSDSYATGETYACDGCRQH